MVREIIPARMKAIPSCLLVQSTLILIAATVLAVLHCGTAAAADHGACVSCHTDDQRMKSMVKPPDLHGEAEG